MSRIITYAQAVLEATDQCMAEDLSVYIMGLGVPDPKGIFGTTVGLAAKYGPDRVMDMPVSENAMTGVAIGSALAGMRPVMTHQRVDFALLALDQIINNGAKWHYMFGGKMKVPMVIRLLIGRGWGQGPQHSQSLQSIFAHIPGLKVVMPATPYDAKGLLISAIRDENPVIFIEHRWLHGISGDVPARMYTVPIGKAKTVCKGRDVTIAASSHMAIEALRAATLLEKDGISAEVVDIRSLRPFDGDAVISSVKKTRRLLVADDGWSNAGFSAEVIARVSEYAFKSLRCAPRRLTLADAPVPTSRTFIKKFYPGVMDICNAARNMLGLAEKTEEQLGLNRTLGADVPDKNFKGPF